MPIPPKPDLTEPQMNPYYVVDRSWKVSKYNRCGVLFNKRNPELYILKRNELDWWPKSNKANLTKQRCQSACNRYYCLKLECLQKRKPLLSLPNVSIYSQEDSAFVKNLVNELFEICCKHFAVLLRINQLIFVS